MIQLLTPTWVLRFRAVPNNKEGGLNEYLQKLAEEGKVLFGLYVIPSSQKRIALRLSRPEFTLADTMIRFGKLRFVGFYAMTLKTYEKCCNGAYLFGTFKEIFDWDFDKMCSEQTLWGSLVNFVHG